MLDRLLRIWRSKTVGKSHVQEQVMFATTLKWWKRISRRNKGYSLYMLSSLYIVHLFLLFVLMSVSCISVEYMYISRILAIHYFLLLGKFGHRKGKQAYKIDYRSWFSRKLTFLHIITAMFWITTIFIQVWYRFSRKSQKLYL